MEAIRNGINALSETTQVLENEDEQQNTSLIAKIKETIQNQKNALDGVVQDFQHVIQNQISPRIQQLRESTTADRSMLGDEISALDDKVRELGYLTREMIQIAFDQAVISYAMHDVTPTKSSNSHIVRLVGGGKNYGKVEIYHDGEWGVVCNDGWDKRHGNKVCKMLGYSRASSVYSVGRRWGRRGRIWTVDERCDERELSFEKCIKSNRSWHSCRHHRDASVRCE